jgi:hypothetical protein
MLIPSSLCIAEANKEVKDMLRNNNLNSKTIHKASVVTDIVIANPLFSLYKASKASKVETKDILL